MLLLKPRRLAQPHGAAAPDWANPLTRELLFLMVPPIQWDLVRRTPMEGSPATLRYCSHGLQFAGTGGYSRYFSSRPDLGEDGTSKLSVMVVGNIASASAAFGYFLGRSNVAFSNHLFSLYVNGVSDTRFWAGMGSDKVISYPATDVAGQLDPISGKDVVIISTWDGATVTLTVRELGGPWGGTNSAALSGSFSSSVDPLQLLSAGNADRLTSAGLLSAAIWKRPLSAGERNAIVANPWQLFAPAQQRRWLPVQHDLSASHTRQRIAISLAPLQTTHLLGAGQSAQASSASPGTIQQVHHLGTAPSAQHTAVSSTHLQQLHMLAVMPTQQRTASSTGNAQPVHQLGAVHSASAHGSSESASQQAHLLGPTGTAQRAASWPTQVLQIHALTGAASRQRHASTRAAAVPGHQLGSTHCRHRLRSTRGALPGFNVGPSRYLVHVPALPNRVEAPEHLEFD